jgi:outer membrane protein, heavy metal efflux system
MPKTLSIGMIIALFTTFAARAQNASAPQLAPQNANPAQPAPRNPGPITQDTIRLDLFHAEKLFIDSNLQLLAQRYNIDANEALVLQAKLWPNPNFGVGHTLYSAQLRQFFPTGYNDETTFELDQLILLAGKRNKQIKLAQATVKLTKYQFFDLLRTLKYTLRTDFFNIYYLEQSAKAYSEEIRALQKVVDAYAQAQLKGYIAEKDVVRIKAQLYSFVSEYNDLINQINDTESELRLTLQAKPNVFIDPTPDSTALDNLDPEKYPLNTLIDSAYQNRTDLNIAKTNTEINQLNYSYQKALAIPDLTVSLNYDEAGSFDYGYYGIGASIDLPVFNRNQGNIRNARILIANTQATQRYTRLTVDENVSRALQKAYAQQKLYKSIDPKFADDFQRLAGQVLLQYEHRNLGLLDFLDFYDAYKQNVLQVNSIKYNRVQAFEDLNYYTATNLFN